MKWKYNVFISYRREGGEALACLLCERLKKLGCSVFYDVESLRNGMFNEKIYKVIDSVEDVIIVLPPKGLNRCNEENDWVRNEIEYAIEKNKNIVPVMMRGFKFPKTLQGKINQLRDYNGVNADMEYFDATFDKLTDMLKTFLNRKFININSNLIYYTFSQYKKPHRVICRLKVDNYSHAILYVNLKGRDISNAEYRYQGEATETDNNIYITLSNEESSEVLQIVFIKAAKKFNRYIGILMGLSPAMMPVCFKCICIPDDDIQNLDEDIVLTVLKHSNKEWNNNILALESYQANLFYSDAIFSK